MFFDPYSEAEDFDDARYLGLCVWGDRDEFIARYGPDAGKVFDETVPIGQVGGSFDDKPKNQTWVGYDNKRYRVRIVQMYYRTAENEWHFCEFTKGGFLAAGVSPWLDDSGIPEHPYAWGSANVDRDNNRYGEVRNLIDHAGRDQQAAEQILAPDERAPDVWQRDGHGVYDNPRTARAGRATRWPFRPRFKRQMGR